MPETARKGIFFDKIGSNNAKRIRIWLQLKGLEDRIETKWVHKVEDLRSPEFQQINPLQKVPAFITETGLHLYEARVILDYLEDKYGCDCSDKVVDMILKTPEDRAFVNLLVRIHDLYIASPNCTQPGFSHTQGCMYLTPHETPFCPARRIMDTSTRAAKLKEIHHQLTWLEDQVRLPFLAGPTVTHADCTWFPTAVFMEFYLPRVFQWAGPIFHEHQVFPKLTKWFEHCYQQLQPFATARKQILETLQHHESEGHLEPIQQVVRDNPQIKWKYM